MQRFECSAYFIKRVWRAGRRADRNTSPARAPRARGARDHSRRRRARASRCVPARSPSAGCARVAVGRTRPPTAPAAERADRTLPTLTLNLLFARSSHRATETRLSSGWNACGTHQLSDSARTSRPRHSRSLRHRPGQFAARQLRRVLRQPTVGERVPAARADPHHHRFRVDVLCARPIGLAAFDPLQLPNVPIYSSSPPIKKFNNNNSYVYSYTSMQYKSVLYSCSLE